MPALSRRSLIAAATALPLIAACQKESAGITRHGSTAAQKAASPTTGSTKLSRLYKPGSAEYQQSKQLFDPEFDTRQPAAVARVASAEEVGNSFRYARSQHLRVSARSGGHSYVGASAPDHALVVDLRDLDQVSYDSNTSHVTIGAGARLYDVHTKLASFGRAIPTGTCPTVGVSGLTAGGGLGVKSRQYGLTCDALVSARIVLPDGQSLHVDASHHPEIFWALRGGGGGLVGIVTDWTFTTHPATSQGSFLIDVPADDPEKVLRGWASWVESSPRSQWANLHLTKSGAGVSIRFVGITDVGDQQTAGAALLKACGESALHATYGQRSHLETVAFLGGGTTSPRTAFTAGSDVIRTMDAATASALVAAVKASTTSGAAVLDPLTGAVQDHSPSSTAFPWRRHLASVQWYTGSTAPAARTWLAAAHRQLGSHSTGRYVNYVEAGTSLQTYLGPNARQASAVRRKHDPENMLVTSLGM